MTGLRLIAILSGSCILSACVSGARIYSTTDPTADFVHYRSFAFQPQLATDSRDGTASIVSSHLKQATRIEMENRGYVYDANTPDLRVNFYLHAEKKTQTVSVPTTPVGYGYGYGYGYYGYRAGLYEPWGGYETEVTQYTEGTLHIDLVETRRKQLVWEGVAIGRIRQRDREQLDKRVAVVVDEVFQKFPFWGAGAPVSSQP